MRSRNFWFSIILTALGAMAIGWAGFLAGAGMNHHAVASLPPRAPSFFFTWDQVEQIQLPDEFISVSSQLYTIQVTTTGSMKPTLDDHSKVLMFRTDAVNIGDIVGFKDQEGRDILHRIVGERNGEWVTKGDANAVSDPELLPKDRVQGRVIAIFY